MVSSRLVCMAALVGVAASAAPQIDLRPGAVVVLVAGLKEIRSYDQNGVLLSTLPLDPSIVHPQGLTILGRSVYILTDSGVVGRVNPITGAMFGTFQTPGAAGLGDNGKNLIVSAFQSSTVYEFTQSGNQVRRYSLTSLITGLDAGPDGFFVGTYASGLVHRFSPSGQPIGSFQAGVGAGSISGLGWDWGSNSVWVVSGTGDGNVRQFSATGKLLRQLNLGPFIMGLDVVSSS